MNESGEDLRDERRKIRAHESELAFGTCAEERGQLRRRSKAANEQEGIEPDKSPLE